MTAPAILPLIITDRNFWISSASILPYEFSVEYIFGNFLIAPVLFGNEKTRLVYLPEGTWINLWTGENASGPSAITMDIGEERIPVFIRSGKALLIDLDNGRAPGIWNKNGRSDTPSQEELLYLDIGGELGTDVLHLDPERSIIVQWDADQITLKVTGVSGQTTKRTCMLQKENIPVEQNSLDILLSLAVPGTKSVRIFSEEERFQLSEYKNKLYVEKIRNSQELAPLPGGISSGGGEIEYTD